MVVSRLELNAISHLQVLVTKSDATLTKSCGNKQDNKEIRETSATEIIESAARLLFLLSDNDLQHEPENNDSNTTFIYPLKYSNQINKDFDNGKDIIGENEKFIYKSKVVIRKAFLFVFSTLGHAEQLRNFILHTLPTMRISFVSRDLLLEVLPYCMPIRAEEIETQMVQNTQVIETLQSLLHNDHTAFLTIVKILPMLRLTTFEDKIKLINLCEKCLSVVSEKDLPILIRTLLSYLGKFNHEDIFNNLDNGYVNHHGDNVDVKVENNEKIDEVFFIQGIEAIRNEWTVLEKSFLDNSKKEGEFLEEDVNVGVRIVEEMFHALKKYPDLALAYMSYLLNNFLPIQCCNKNQTGSKSDHRRSMKNRAKNSKEKEHNVKETWIMLDLIAMLFLFHCSSIHREDIEHLIQSLCYYRNFPFEALKEKLLKCYFEPISTISSDRKKFSSSIYSILVPALMELSLYLFLTPIRRLTDRFFLQYPFCNSSFSINKSHTLDYTHHLFICMFNVLHIKEREDVVQSLMGLSSRSNFIQPLISSIHCNVRKLDDEKSTGRTTKLHPASNIQSNSINIPRKPSKKSKFLLESLPLLLQNLISSNDNNSHCQKIAKSKDSFYECKDVYNIAKSSLRILAYLSQDKRLGGELQQYKHIFIDRLSIFSDSSTRLWEGMEQQISGEEFEQYTNCDYVIVHGTCHILVSLEEQNSDIHESHNCNVENYKMELLHMVQRLLFSSSEPKFAEPNHVIGKEKERRLVLGIILGKYLVQSSICNNSDRDEVFRWVLQIILPQPYKQRNNPQQNISPVVGFWGLYFLISLCSEMNDKLESFFGCQDDQSKNYHHYFKGKPVLSLYSALEIFNHVKTILARTSLIQMVDKRVQKENQSVLGFVTIPSYYGLQGKKVSNLGQRKMVFCISSFLSKVSFPSYEDTTSPHVFCRNVSEWVRYIHALIDIYLQMGRMISKSKWSPNNWLLAQLELPRLLDTESPFELDQNDTFCEYFNCHESQCLDLIQRKQFLLSYVSACLLSIGLYSAVFKNSLNHYTNRPQENKNNRVALKLIQFHCAKIYKVKELCHYALQVLEFDYQGHSKSPELEFTQVENTCNKKKKRVKQELFVGTSPLKKARPYVHLSMLAKNKHDVKKEGDSKQQYQTTGSISSLSDQIFENVYYFPPDSLLLSLPELDPSKLFLNRASNKNLCNNSKYWKDLGQASELTQSIITHVYVIMSRRENIENCNTSSFVQTIDVCTSSNRYISDLFSRIVKGVCNKKNIKLMIDITNHTSTCLTHFTSKQTSITTDKDLLLKSLKSLLSCNYVLLHYFLKRYMTSEPNESKTVLKTLFKGNSGLFFIKQSLPCDNKILTFQLLDILSTLSTTSEVLPRGVVRDTSWEVLFSSKLETSSSLTNEHLLGHCSILYQLPFAFVETILWQLNTRPPQKFEEPIHRFSLVTLLRNCTNKSQSFQDCALLRFNLLLHWGLLGGTGYQLCQDIGELVSTLNLMLSQFLNKSVKTRAAKKRLVNHDNLSCNSISPLPGCLTIQSFCVLYDLIICMVITSFSISQPHASNNEDTMLGHRKSLNVEHDTGPYRELQGFLNQFTTLIGIFKQFVTLLSSNSLTVTIQCCFHMLKYCNFQIHNCLKWRASQPFNASNVDFASLHYLHPLLESMIHNCAECIKSFCEMMRNHTHINNEDESDSESTDNDVTDFFCHSTMFKKMTTLDNGCDKLMSQLNSIKKVHNLLPSALECLTSDDQPSQISQKLDILRSSDIITSNECVNISHHDLIESDNDSFGVIGEWVEEGNEKIEEEIVALDLEIAV